MQYENLGEVEKKVLGALMILADIENNKVKATMKDIADTIGYKVPGGAITYALRGLERDNFILRSPQNKQELKLLV